MTTPTHPSQNRSVIEQLVQDARVIRSGRMLPDGELTPDQLKQIARDVTTFAREKRISLKDIASGLGVSPAQISHFVNAKYIGTSQDLARRLNAWLSTRAEAVEVALAAGYVETDVAKHMLTVVRKAVTTASIAVITGPAGVGKTITARAAESIYPGAIYIRVTQATKRHTGFINSVARRLNVQRRSGFDGIYASVVQVLSGSGRLIIIDEAHMLSATAMDAVRDLHDEARLPIVLIGTNSINDAVNDRQVYFGQFSSRVIARIDITELAIERDSPSGARKRNHRPLFTAAEIRGMVEGDGFTSGDGKLRLTDDAAEWLAWVAGQPGVGGVRLVTKVVQIARSMSAVRASGRIDQRCCEQVVREMHGAAMMELLKFRGHQAAKEAVA